MKITIKEELGESVAYVEVNDKEELDIIYATGPISRLSKEERNAKVTKIFKEMIKELVDSSIQKLSSSENDIIENEQENELRNYGAENNLEIIKKMKYYNPEYIKCLMNETGVLFKDKNEVYRLLYGGYANPNEFGKRPLSKFIKDIYYDTKEMLNGLDIFSEDENTN